jgi:Ribbon-helix-helix domain
MPKQRTDSKSRLVKQYLSLYLDPPQAAALKLLSDRTRVPQQVYLREGVETVLDKYKKLLKVGAK